MKRDHRRLIHMYMPGFIQRIRKEREVIRLFREQGACSPDLAVPPAVLHPEWSRYRPELNRFLSRGVVLRADENRYYLDESRLLQRRVNRSKWWLVFLLALCLVIMAVLTAKK